MLAGEPPRYRRKVVAFRRVSVCLDGDEVHHHLTDGQDVEEPSLVSHAIVLPLVRVRRFFRPVGRFSGHPSGEVAQRLDRWSHRSRFRLLSHHDDRACGEGCRPWASRERVTDASRSGLGEVDKQFA